MTDEILNRSGETANRHPNANAGDGIINRPVADGWPSLDRRAGIGDSVRRIGSNGSVSPRILGHDVAIAAIHTRRRRAVSGAGGGGCAVPA